MGQPIRKGFVSVAGRDVHYRTAGTGPAVVLLHDSPRSSAMHTPLLETLSDDFTVIALDTPGNGHSAPLPGPSHAVADFADALAETLEALGLAQAGFYGFHTSSKILLEFAVRFPERVSVAILDGISLPEGGPNAEFIAAYMRPFTIEQDGAHVAREWTRLRDSSRWFPWFSRDPAHRIGAPAAPPAQAHQGFLDYFSAGPHYLEVYTAAMQYLAAPRIKQLAAPTVIMARQDDVLYAFLDKLPLPLPEGCSVERLTPDREAWRARVKAILLDHVATGPAPVFVGPTVGAAASGYLDLPHGQMRLRRFGDGAGRPILYLHELPGGAGAEDDFLRALGAGRSVIAPDLPGCGLSDPLPQPTSEAYVEALAAALTQLALGPMDLVAELTGTPLALRLLAREPQRFHRAVLDGVLLADAPLRAALVADYCPPLVFDRSGAHLHKAWHMLRDQAIQWPWYDGSSPAARRTAAGPDGLRLHRRFLDVLNQMDRYGDAVYAALEFDAAADLTALRIPTLATRQDGDARYGWAQAAADLSAHVEIAERPAAEVERAALFHDFFDRSRPEPRP